MSKFLEDLTQNYIRQYPQHIIRLLYEEKPRFVKELLSVMEVQDLTNVLLKADINGLKKIWNLLDDKKKIQLIDSLSMDRLMYFFPLIPQNEQKKIVSQLNEKTQNQIKKYQEDKIFNLIPKIHRAFTVELGATVGDVIKQLSLAQETIYKYIYILDNEKKLAGVILLRELYRNDRHLKINTIMQQHVASIKITDLQLTNLRYFFRYYSICPIVNEQGQFLGIIKSESLDKYLNEAEALSFGEGASFVGELMINTTTKIFDIFVDTFQSRKS